MSLLFENVVPVRIKSGSQDRQAELTIRILTAKTSKVLQIQITDEADPFFFYMLDVNEDDFQSLKVEQCILVDFATFPHKLIELLEHCIRARSDDYLRFVAVLDVRPGDSTFGIVETNKFKHLSHLLLCLRQGTDSTVKAYLAVRLGEFKAGNAGLQDRLEKALGSLQNSLYEAENLKKEMLALKQAHARSMTDLSAKHTMDVALVKEKAMQESSMVKEKLERDRADMEYRLRQRADVQEEHVTELNKQLREALAKAYDLEMRTTEQKTRLESLETSLLDRQQEGHKLRTKNGSLQMQLQECLKQNNQQLVRLAALEQEVQDKNDLIMNMTKRLESEASHRTALEMSLKDAQAAADRAEEKANASLLEACNCNQAMERLQGELKACKAKVKLKAQMLAQQDSLLHERQATIENGSTENSSLRQEVAALKSENDSFRKKADEYQRQLEEMQDASKSNQQMIQWLNQQLTDSQLCKFGFSSRYSFKGNADSATRGFGSSTFTSLAGKLSPESFRNALPSARRSPSSHTKSLSPVSPSGISKVIFKPPHGSSSEQTPCSQTSVSIFKSEEADTGHRTYTVELKRSRPFTGHKHDESSRSSPVSTR